MAKILWKPSDQLIHESHMKRFIGWANERFGAKLINYSDLYDWSISQSDSFWSAVWDFCGIKSNSKGNAIKAPGETFWQTQWFAEARLNFAENLLQRNDDHLALIFVGEDGRRAQITYRELNQQVSQAAHYLRTLNIQPGDRIAGFLPNTIETVIAMLASARIGAVWSSCSPDFGLQGLLDRFGQIEPKVLFAVNSHVYNGKTFHHLETIAALQKQITSIKKTIIVQFTKLETQINNLSNAILWPDIFSDADQEDYDQFPFNHPVYILYTSGTTGKPKCLVHSAGGTLIQHLKELMLHTNVHSHDRIFYYTTCGWMMWNWLVSNLAIGATVVLYDGAPLYPNPQRLFNLIDELDITIFGISAKFLEAVEKAQLEPIKTHSLQSLHTILSTGSPLLPESFDYVYNKVKTDVCLSSISGGSDIISCFALGNPLLPVYQGELQSIGLGMAVKIFNESGIAVKNEKGELVCTQPFPSMPIGFWNDARGKKYQDAYFNKFPNVWTHGDYAMLTDRNTLVIYGRSDATLNPGGVRVGTAEIYNQLNQFSEIVESLAVAQRWANSERIILFVKLAASAKLTDALIATIKKTIKVNVSPHHVPAKIIAVADLPRTLNNKVAELAVKKIIHHEPINNIESLANPEALENFKNITALEEGDL